MDKPITLQDVADYCGVSHQTVSRVINGNPNVAAATRQRITAAIETLGYEPNQAARTLVTRRTSMIEVMTYGLAHYGPAQMVSSVEQAAKTHGYQVIFSSLEDVTTIRRNGINADGVIAITPVQSPVFDDLERAFKGVPLIKIGIKLGDHGASVMIDQVEGSRQITQHLIEWGHRRIAYISGPPAWYDASERYSAWMETLHTNALDPGNVETGDWTAAGGYHAAKRLLAQPDYAFTALVVANDQMALGAISALRVSGLHVPNDVSVVGFDDIPEAAYFDPPLTTVRQDFDRVGKQSVQYVLDMIQHPNTPLRQQVVFPEIIYRQSVARRSEPR